MARILGIDYGKKRTGMAWTDELQISINPLPTQNTEVFQTCICELMDTGQISDVVFGLPSHSDGTITNVGNDVLKLIQKLQNKYQKISFHTIDEAFSSQRARQMMLHLGTKKKSREKKENVDRMSAVLILKDFIDRI